MTIKMRNNTNANATCCECGDSQNNVLNMFDLLVGGKILTICDVCNEKVLYKTLHANVLKDGRVKSQHDMSIIRRRKNGDRF